MLQDNVLLHILIKEYCDKIKSLVIIDERSTQTIFHELRCTESIKSLR